MRVAMLCTELEYVALSDAVNEAEFVHDEILKFLEPRCKMGI